MSVLERRPRGTGEADGDGQVFVGSLWMLGSTLAVSLGSFVFWLVAARMSDADVVGRSAGLFSAVFFLSYATSLGLPVAVGRHAATSDPLQTSRFRISVVATFVASALGATALVIIDPADLLVPVMSQGSIIGWLVLVGLAGGVAVSVLVDVRLMGHRRWRSVFVRSAAIAVVRIPPLLWAVDDSSGFWIFVVAAGGYAITAVPYLPALLGGGVREPLRWVDHAEAVRYSLVNYASQLAVQAPLFVTPLVVALVVSDEENATFYLSWGIMTVVYLGIHLLGRTLLVEGSRTQLQVMAQARTTLALGLAVAVPATVLSVPAAPVAERIYGPEHGDMSAMLPLLMLGTIPWVVTRTALAVARVTDDSRTNLLVAGFSAFTVLVGVAVGGAMGDAVGASTGWAIGSVAALGATGPVLWAQLRRPA